MASPEAAALPEGAVESLAGRVGKVAVAELGSTAPGRGLRIGICCARFNGGITWRLLEGALGALGELGVDRADVTVAWVPGAFELPLAALGSARAGADAVVCLGAVIRGETGHYDFVAGGCATGIQRVALDTGTPLAFGVLTTDTLDQALARSAPDDENKGREAARTAVEMARFVRGL